MATAQFVHVKGHRMSLLDGEQSYLKSDQFTPREKIALRYCDAIIGNPMHADDAMWEELHKNFTEPELVELGHYIGYMSGGQKWLPSDFELFGALGLGSGGCRRQSCSRQSSSTTGASRWL